MKKEELKYWYKINYNFKNSKNILICKAFRQQCFINLLVLFVVNKVNLFYVVRCLLAKGLTN